MEWMDLNGMMGSGRDWNGIWMKWEDLDGIWMNGGIWTRSRWDECDLNGINGIAYGSGLDDVDNGFGSDDEIMDLDWMMRLWIWIRWCDYGSGSDDEIMDLDWMMWLWIWIRWCDYGSELDDEIMDLD